MKSAELHNIWAANEVEFEKTLNAGNWNDLVEMDRLFASYFPFLDAGNVFSMRHHFKNTVAHHPEFMEQYDGVVDMLCDFLNTREWLERMGVKL